MSDKFKNPNKEEYSFLRDEIMQRLSWHQDFSKHAVTTCISVWVGTFALTYFFEQSFFNFVSFIFLLPILVLWTISFKTYENYVKIAFAGTYLKRFHERCIEDNDGTYFSWERANAKILDHFKDNKNTAISMNSSNIELVILACISLILFTIFCVVSLIKDFNVIYLIVSIVALVIAAIITFFTHRNSAYKRFGKIFEAADNYWNDYGCENITE